MESDDKGEDRPSVDAEQMNPVSFTPSVQSDHILPSQGDVSPVITAMNYDNVIGSMGEKPAQDLHGILEAFDPLMKRSEEPSGAPSDIAAPESTGTIPTFALESTPDGDQSEVLDKPIVSGFKGKACMRLRGTRPDVAMESYRKLEEAANGDSGCDDENMPHSHLDQEQAALKESSAPKDEQNMTTATETTQSRNAINETTMGPDDIEHALSEANGSHNEKSQRHEPDISEEELRPFDFQRFLDQLRHKSADPIARYVKSFLHEFNKRYWSANEQVKIVGDFRVFISSKMKHCRQFANLNDNEWRNALEGMEKLIMNRLYSKTFSPEISPEVRDGSHEDDVLRDHILEEKMRIWHWIQGRHLDIPERFLRNGDSFVRLASDELGKINHYRAPRDKMICILNCCKVIFGLLRQSKSEESADRFLPILIYIVLKAQPKSLISNVNYIQRFRDPDRLGGEAGYYLSSVVGAVAFLETLDRSRLSISDDEFEANVEQSVRSIAECRSSAEVIAGSQPPETPDRRMSPCQPAPSGVGQPETLEAGEQTGTETPTGMNASTVLLNSAGLFTAPFKSLSRMFEADPNEEDSAGEGTMDKKEPQISPDELAARQVSAEEHEAQRIYEEEFVQVIDTFRQMFPTLDQEIIEDVVRQKEGRVGPAVDACLSLLST